MPQCSFVTADSQVCTHRADPDALPGHLHSCGIHSRAYARMIGLHDYHHRADQCVYKAGGPRNAGGWCGETRVGETPYCAHHHRYHETRREQVRARRDTRAQQDAVMGAMLGGFLGRDPRPAWEDVVREVHGLLIDVAPERTRYRVALQYYTHVVQNPDTIDFNIEWNRARIQARPPADHARGMLGALARDGQNVHTGVVSNQTNLATEKLLSIRVPEHQHTERTLNFIWLGSLGVPFATYLRVATDINRWFNTNTCRVDGDNLYRKLLRGLVAFIGYETDDERKTEMFRRLWEESCEATGMCCEGHISRLCNVLVGFDDNFQPPVSFGEVLQNTMSAIAGTDVSDDEKRRLANAFFDEHSIPASDRVVWLEAF